MNRMGTTKRNKYIYSILFNKERTHVFDSTFLCVTPPRPTNLRYQALRLKSYQTESVKSPIFENYTESLKVLKMYEQPDKDDSNNIMKFGENAAKVSEKIDDMVYIKPRSYQLEMFEESRKQNVIVAMDTGSGKTQVAVMRMNYELERMSKDKLIWFLAPTVSLCLQQYEYIKSQISYVQIKFLCGADRVDRWTEQHLWDSVLKNVTIVVSTHQILLDALTHGFVKLESLALLVLDEAHNCVGRSPGAKIMQNFYHPRKSSGLEVPHILGLTASPLMGSKIDSLVDIEKNLDSISRTPTKTKIDLKKRVKLPTLIKITHDAPDIPLTSDFTESIRSLESIFRGLKLEDDPRYLNLAVRTDPRGQREFAELVRKERTWCREQLLGLLNMSKRIYTELGLWAADHFILVTQVISRVSTLAKESQEIFGIWEESLENTEKKYLVKLLQQITMPKETSSNYLGMPYVSDKVSKLIDILKEQGTEFTGIIFVQERAVVASLAELLAEHPSCRDIVRVGKFVGNSMHSKRLRSTFDLIDEESQTQALPDFKSGKTNLLIGTSVLEEGIDVPTCNLVVCFQEPSNLKSYIQRRGRARKSDSKLYLINSSHNKSARFKQLEEEMRAIYEDESRTLQENLSQEDPEEDIEDCDRSKFKVEKTGAILEFDNAVSHLYHFCATLPANKYVDRRPEFICTEAKRDLHHVKIILPISVHESVRTAESLHLWKNERNAIKDAAFQACLALYRAQLLSDNLLPLMRHSSLDSTYDTMVEKRPSVINAQEQMNPWFEISKAWLNSPSTLYRSTIRFNGQEIDLFIPTSLPNVTKFEVFWDENTKMEVSIDSLTVEVRTNPEMLKKLHEETSALIHAAFPSERHRTDEIVIGLSAKSEDSFKSQLGKMIVPENIDNITDIGIIRDNQDVGYLFKELLPQKPDIKDVRHPQHNYEEYPTDVPYLSLVRLSRRRDFMHPILASVADSSAFPHSIVKPITHCRIDKMPFRLMQFAFMIPSIMRQLELNILAKNLSENLLREVHLSDISLVRMAICASSAGETVDYQRLEFLGDTVLKFFGSVQIMAENPLWHEGNLTLRKNHLVANSRLARAAVELGIDKYIVTNRFTGNKWHPAYVKNSSDTQENEQREMSTKILADIIESLLGACILDGGFPKAITCLGIFLPELKWKPLEDHRLTLFDEAPALNLPSHLEPLQTLFGYCFKKPSLLIEALTHASYTSGTCSLERLEFLGDSLLDFIIVQEIYSHNLSHVRMHEIRTAMVNADLLAFICFEVCVNLEVFDIEKIPEEEIETDISESSTRSCRQKSRIDKIPLYRFMRHNSYQISQVQKITADRYIDLRDQINSELHSGNKYPWRLLCSLHAEKFYSDMAEAILGAVWIDSGSLNKVRDIVESMGILKILRRVITKEIDTEHPKITLGKLANDQPVRYVFEQQDDSIDSKPELTCQVFVGEIEVAKVNGDLGKIELETRAAIAAIDNLIVKPIEERNFEN
ncbi:Dicer-like protein 2 [Golovinomyces cichoracearum]|uniref:Dicer-like protein 2 n=1 Tax=Golovinomyces cichoracearum TaxID=62708 RepID=A0A420IL61_9PEZI|nr:Dicer-like protein 2 [Golovinomyces cichoracearum]